MSLTKEQKQKIVEELKEKIDKQKSMVFVAIEGLKAADIFDLRKKLGEADCQLQVIKKTLADIVFKKKKLEFDIKKVSLLWFSASETKFLRQKFLINFH